MIQKNIEFSKRSNKFLSFSFLVEKMMVNLMILGFGTMKIGYIF
jgi:hypothetical protein